MIYALLLIVMMLVRPEGLLGNRELWKVRRTQTGDGIMALLEIKNLGIDFGGLRALAGFDFSLDQGELVGLIGPNGAGKTTVFNIVTGVYCPTAGDVRLCGHSIAGKKPFRVNRLGIARTFQNVRLFGGLSVLDNVLIGFNRSVAHGFLGTLVRSKKHQIEETTQEEQAIELLRTFDLVDRLDDLCADAGVRVAAEAGNRTGAGDGAEDSDAGRAGRGDEPAGKERPDGADPFRAAIDLGSGSG